MTCERLSSAIKNETTAGDEAEGDEGGHEGGDKDEDADACHGQFDQNLIRALVDGCPTEIDCQISAAEFPTILYCHLLSMSRAITECCTPDEARFIQELPLSAVSWAYLTGQGPFQDRDLDGKRFHVLPAISPLKQNPRPSCSTKSARAEGQPRRRDFQNHARMRAMSTSYL